MKTANHITIPSIFNTVLNYIINILIRYIIVVLTLSLGKILYTMGSVFSGNQIGTFLSHSITDILSFLVMMELFRSFVEYCKAKRMKTKYQSNKTRDSFLCINGKSKSDSLFMEIQNRLPFFMRDYCKTLPL